MRWNGDHELCRGKDFEGGSQALVQSTIPEFTWKDWRKPQKLLSGKLVTWMQVCLVWGQMHQGLRNMFSKGFFWTLEISSFDLGLGVSLMHCTWQGYALRLLMTFQIPGGHNKETATRHAVTTFLCRGSSCNMDSTCDPVHHNTQHISTTPLSSAKWQYEPQAYQHVNIPSNPWWVLSWERPSIIEQDYMYSTGVHTFSK